MELCSLCPRNCNSVRNDTIGKGFCGIPDKIFLAHYGLHFYEEPVISGKNGSGTIFFSGCNLKCDYCQNHKISNKVCGKEFSIQEFILVMKELVEKGANNINLVSPTPYSKQIIEALKIYRPPVPIVYNTSGYEKAEIIEKLLDYVDIFLTDFKYGYNEIGEKYSHCKNYVDFAKESLKVMLKKQNVFKNDLMVSGVICRHLILPNNIQNSIKVLEIMNELNVKFISIMAQFTPITDTGELNRPITKREYNKILDELYKYDNFDGFVQERDSVGKEYVPDFCFIKK